MDKKWIVLLILLFLIGCVDEKKQVKHYCTEQNTSDRIMCAEFYQKVCGYFEDGYSSKEFGNGCHACRTPGIEYWIDREC